MYCDFSLFVDPFHLAGLSIKKYVEMEFPVLYMSCRILFQLYIYTIICCLEELIPTVYFHISLWARPVI